jgi:hypothetical protein
VANRRVTELPAILSSNIDDSDLLMVVDVAEVDPGLKNKKLTFATTKQYFNGYYLQITGGTIAGSLVITNDLTVSGTFTPNNLNITGSGTIGTLIVTGNAEVKNVLSGNIITGNSIQATNLNAVTGNITNLINSTATIGTGNFTRVSGQLITGNTASIGTGTVFSLTGTNANISNISGTNITGTQIVGTTLVSGATVTGNIVKATA